jgi:tyrosyl-tRNA synthetase
LPLEEIARLEALEGAEINAAKIVLANEATALCRGTDAAQQAADTARKTFEEGSSGDALPTFATPDRINIVDALIGLGFCTSKGEARRLIAGGGARVEGEKVDELFTIDVGTEPVRVSAGKKHHGLLTRAPA